MDHTILESSYDIIKQEAIDILNNREVHDIIRSKGTNSSLVQYKNGWVKSWTNDPKWLNFGYIYSNMYLHDELKITPILKEWERINNKKIQMAGLSLLKAGGVIPPHVDHTPSEQFTSIIRMGLDIPEGCWLDLDGEKIFDADRKIICFNDYTMHSSYNTSDKDRLTLYVQY